VRRFAVSSLLQATLLILSSAAAFAQDAPLPAGVTAPTPTASPRHSCPVQQWYPRGAIARNEGGETQLNFHIGTDGAPKDITVATSSGFPDIDQAAASCLATFRYNPAMQNGQPVEVAWHLAISFGLSDGPHPLPPVHDCRDEAQAAESGAREVDLTIAVDGSVKAVQFGAPGHDASADQALIACMMKWRYQPAMKNSKPEEFTWKMPYIALTMPPIAGGM